MPTEPVSPKPVARPCSPTAAVYSPAVMPVWAHAVRFSVSISSAFISRRSSTMAPSPPLSPAVLCPPLRTANGTPSSFATVTATATCAAPVGRRITAGRGSNMP